MPPPRHVPASQGRPIYIQLLGKIDINTLKKITSEERMVKFHIQVSRLSTAMPWHAFAWILGCPIGGIGVGMTACMT